MALIESKEAMDMEEPSVPGMNDPTQKALCLTLQRFSKELDDIAPLAYEEDDRDEKERASGVHIYILRQD